MRFFSYSDVQELLAQPSTLRLRKRLAAGLVLPAVAESRLRVVPESFIGALSLVTPDPTACQIECHTLDEGENSSLWRKLGKEATGLSETTADSVPTTDSIWAIKMPWLVTGSQAQPACVLSPNDILSGTVNLLELSNRILRKWAAFGPRVESTDDELNLLEMKLKRTITADGSFDPSVGQYQRYLLPPSDPLATHYFDSVAGIQSNSGSLVLDQDQWGIYERIYKDLASRNPIEYEALANDQSVNDDYRTFVSQGLNSQLFAHTTAAAVYWKFAWCVMRYGHQDSSLYRTLESFKQIGNYPAYEVTAYHKPHLPRRLILLGPCAVLQTSDRARRLELNLGTKIWIDTSIYDEVYCY